MSVLRPALLRQDGVCLARVYDLHQHAKRATVHAEGDRECRRLPRVALQLSLLHAAAAPSNVMHQEETARGLVDVHDAVCADSWTRAKQKRKFGQKGRLNVRSTAQKKKRNLKLQKNIPREDLSPLRFYINSQKLKTASNYIHYSFKLIRKNKSAPRQICNYFGRNGMVRMTRRRMTTCDR